MNLNIPPVFLFSDRVYTYSLSRFDGLDGRHLAIEGMVLEHGVRLSGNFIVRAQSNQSCVHLTRSGNDGSPSWIALTFEEATILSSQPEADEIVKIAS